MTSHFAAACFVRLLAMLFAATLLASPAFAQTSASFFITDDEPETPPQPAEEEDFALEDFNQDNSLASYDSYAQAAPNMVGDFFGGGFSGGVIFPNYADFPNVHFPIPLAGGGGLMKSSENNQATTQDRIIFQYSHYNNALEYPGLAPSQSLDQYVVGFEKRLFDGRWSIDIRMPFTSGAQFNDTLNGFAMDAGNVGNLNVGIKRMIYQDSRRSMVVGLAVNTPTGSDVTGNISGSNFTVHNDTVRLAPYFGARLMPNERTFIHGFVQADLTTRGNDVEENGYSFGRLNCAFSAVRRRIRRALALPGLWKQLLLLLRASSEIWTSVPSARAGRHRRIAPDHSAERRRLRLFWAGWWGFSLRLEVGHRRERHGRLAGEPQRNDHTAGRCRGPDYGQ